MPRIERGCLETRHFIFRTGSGVWVESTEGEDDGTQESAARHERESRIDDEKPIRGACVFVVAPLFGKSRF